MTDMPPGWFDPSKPPAEAPSTAPVPNTPGLAVAKTDEAGNPLPAETPATPAAEPAAAAEPASLATDIEHDAAKVKPVVIRLEHAVAAVDKFAAEHPGLDAIFANGLKAALLELEVWAG